MFNSSQSMKCLQSYIPSACGLWKASSYHHVAAASHFCLNMTHPSRNCRHASVRNYHVLQVSTSPSLLSLFLHNYLTRCRFHMLVSCSTFSSQASSSLCKNFIGVRNGSLDKVLPKSFSTGELTDMVYGEHLAKGDHCGNLEAFSMESSSVNRNNSADMSNVINYEASKETTTFNSFNDKNNRSHDIYAQHYFNLMNGENVKLHNVCLDYPDEEKAKTFDSYAKMYSKLAKADGTDRRESEIRLTHTDTDGKAMMVDVGDKTTTLREARAEGRIFLGPEAARLVKENKIKKGDVLTVAQIAGITAAKQTAQLIPLCHNINLTKVDVTCVLNEECDSVDITSLVRTLGVTGVEMEALTAVSVAALTVYDMCKAVTHDMVISDVRLMSKSGGKRHFQR